MRVALYLIPVTLGNSPVEQSIPLYNRRIILGIKFFIVENVRSARRFLKQIDRSIDIDSLTFFTLNKRTQLSELDKMLLPLEVGNSVGLLSEAGCPAVADPGSEVVSIAQRKGFVVVPLVGPSSIILSIMAAGFNGQNFAFNGYLPIGQEERKKRLKKLEQLIYKENQTQIFIETPYRNAKMVDDIIHSCKPTTKLCIAANLTLDNEFVKTKSILEWKNQIPDLTGWICIFLLYK
ncbi:MAG TPA: SAM-dependent methyltransferase [Bacteroidaceae bacterium]|nr:SAM-dependent methyltransferase [Bacteroidaceae bacterium]